MYNIPKGLDFVNENWLLAVLMFLFILGHVYATYKFHILQATPETVDKVCSIVRKQLALPEDSTVTGESKFASLGADSLDTVLCGLFILYYLRGFFLFKYFSYNIVLSTNHCIRYL